MLALSIRSGERDDAIDRLNNSLTQFLDVLYERFDTCSDDPLPQFQDLLHGSLGRKLLKKYAEHYGVASFPLPEVSATREPMQVVTKRAH
jgi:hypothetical protein